MGDFQTFHLNIKTNNLSFISSKVITLLWKLHRIQSNKNQAYYRRFKASFFLFHGHALENLQNQMVLDIYMDEITEKQKLSLCALNIVI